MMSSFDNKRLTLCFQAYSADLILVSARTRLSIPLSGVGVQNTVEVVPTQAAYDMGAVVCPPQCKGTSRLHNNASSNEAEATQTIRYERLVFCLEMHMA